jgi:hypothetical protein
VPVLSEVPPSRKPKRTSPGCGKRNPIEDPRVSVAEEPSRGPDAVKAEDPKGGEAVSTAIRKSLDS